jgi:6-pyruvoyl-tetrahydropterin synthase
VTWHVEPTAENFLIYILQSLGPVLPKNVQLTRLKLYETKDSYAEWVRPTGQKSNGTVIKIIPEEERKEDFTSITGN